MPLLSESVRVSIRDTATGYVDPSTNKSIGSFTTYNITLMPPAGAVSVMHSMNVASNA